MRLINAAVTTAAASAYHSFNEQSACIAFVLTGTPATGSVTYRLTGRRRGEAFFVYEGSITNAKPDIVDLSRLGFSEVSAEITAHTLATSAPAAVAVSIVLISDTVGD